MAVNFPDIHLSPEVTTKVFCDKHKSEELTLYCKPCDDPICLRCKVTSHENHSTMDLSDVAKEARELLGSKLSEAKGFFPLLHEHLSDVNQYEEQLTQTKQDISKSISERASDLIARVDKIFSSMLSDVEVEFRVEVSRIDFQRRAIGKAGKVLASQVHAANQVVNFGSDAEITRNKESLSKRLEKLIKKSEDSDVPKLSLAFSPSRDSGTKIEDLFGSLTIKRPSVVDIKVSFYR